MQDPRPFTSCIRPAANSVLNVHSCKWMSDRLNMVAEIMQSQSERGRNLPRMIPPRVKLCMLCEASICKANQGGRAIFHRMDDNSIDRITRTGCVVSLTYSTGTFERLCHCGSEARMGMQHKRQQQSCHRPASKM